jgi:hypothetical protein
LCTHISQRRALFVSGEETLLAKRGLSTPDLSRKYCSMHFSVKRKPKTYVNISPSGDQRFYRDTFCFPVPANFFFFTPKSGKSRQKFLYRHNLRSLFFFLPDTFQVQVQKKKARIQQLFL